MNAKKILYHSKFYPQIKIKRMGATETNKNEQVAKEVIAGTWGVYPERKKRLSEAGYDYSVIQGIVNEMVSGTYIEQAGFSVVMSASEVQAVLQSMQFTLSRNDITGSFSLTFFPEASGQSLFDKLEIMDVVEIYEPTSAVMKGQKPVFTGIIKNKKYTTQMLDNGGVRRLSVSGIAITGLVSQFYVNLDSSAMAITKQIVSDAAISKELTIEMGSNKNLSIKTVVNKIWEYFIKMSSQNGTPKIAQYIQSLMGSPDEFFIFDNSTFKYPLGCIFKGEQTQDFFGLVDDVIPSPVYEKFACMVGGSMRIKIRQVPFDADKWVKNNKHEIDAKFVKSFDFSQSDNEVYTVFYAYVNGYPIDEQKSLKLSTMENKKDEVLVNSEKYKTYGYRPLIAHFIGYGVKDGEKDDSTQSNLQETCESLKNWYENLPDMLSGSISMVMDYQSGASIMPGDVVKFLNGEFYVEGITHSWNYGSGGEINLSVSRGGSYTAGKFSKLKEVGKLSVLMEEINGN